MPDPTDTTPSKEQSIGQCGEEYWIADELWRMRFDRYRFTRAVCLLVVIGNRKHRRYAARKEANRATLND